MFFDYGTHAFLFAMFGYLVRYKKELSLSNAYIFVFMGIAVIAHSLYQQIDFGLNANEAAFCAGGILAVCIYMTNFKAVTYKGLSAKTPNFLSAPIKLMGRRSLEIYVAHLLILQAIAFYKFPTEYGWFEWTWF